MSVMIGFVPLIYAFRRAAIGIAFVYIPVVAYLLFWFMFVFGMMLSGDSL
jgi:hypothetical protein